MKFIILKEIRLCVLFIIFSGLVSYTCEAQRTLSDLDLSGLDEDEIETLDGCSVSGYDISSGFNKPRTVPFPGNSNFKAHFYKVAEKINGLMNLTSGQIPLLKVYDDGVGQNAIAYNYGVLDKGRYSIVFGKNMLLSHVIPTAENPMDLNTIEMQAILAHEYCHIGQYINGIKGKTVSKELMADFMSGWFVGYIKSYEGQVRITSGLQNEPDIRNAMKDAFNAGDYQYNHPDFHGTPNMRMGAFVHGAALSLKKGVIDWEEAFNYARKLYKL